METSRFRVLSIAGIATGVVGILFCWYLSWVAVLLSLPFMGIFFYLRKIYQSDPFEYHEAFQLGKLAFILNVLSLVLSIFFMLIYLN
ncbi:MAG: hypothetical protein EP338_12660 [Bacteroidetes bacterium]|nr:MAG: hypothetical protein EP338_12660 [Bacteroidota bacterium]